MDPNANLREQLALAAKAIDDGSRVSHDARRLAELVLALDDWLQAGGFAPAAWKTLAR